MGCLSVASCMYLLGQGLFCQRLMDEVVNAATGPAYIHFRISLFLFPFSFFLFPFSFFLFPFSFFHYCADSLRSDVGSKRARFISMENLLLKEMLAGVAGPANERRDKSNRPHWHYWLPPRKRQ